MGEVGGDLVVHCGELSSSGFSLPHSLGSLSACFKIRHLTQMVPERSGQRLLHLNVLFKGTLLGSGLGQVILRLKIVQISLAPRRSRRHSLLVTRLHLLGLGGQLHVLLLKCVVQLGQHDNICCAIATAHHLGQPPQRLAAQHISRLLHSPRRGRHLPSQGVPRDADWLAQQRHHLGGGRRRAPDRGGRGQRRSGLGGDRRPVAVSN
mmetsp:Transcript_20561/g.45338  ORF Transcript_20561/g.45338 Transcript_20561/m.45338 type:complete len:207 (-) Transcript_20561:342-962(-)